MIIYNSDRNICVFHYNKRLKSFVAKLFEDAWLCSKQHDDHIISTCSKILYFKSYCAELLFSSNNNKESSLKNKYDNKNIIVEDVETDFKLPITNNMEMSNEEELAPPKPILSKSISHDIKTRSNANNNNNNNANNSNNEFALNKRVQGLRNWIGTYKRWKSWEDKSPEINEKISPFITSNYCIN